MNRHAAAVVCAVLCAMTWTGVGCRRSGPAKYSREELVQVRPRTTVTNPSSDQSQSVRLSQNGVEVHYAPTEDLEAIDVALLSSAQRNIDISAYSFTDERISSVLMERAEHGVIVRIYRDHESTTEELRRKSATPPLIWELAHTPNIDVRIKRSSVLAHLKAFVVDDAILRTGSANFSQSAEERQDNDLIIVRDAAIAAGFERKFDEMWSRNDNETIR